MDWNVSLQGLMWGAVSAMSLPIGAIIGLSTRPSKKLTSALMAFGGGALLFALTIELFGHALHMASDAHGSIKDAWMVIITIAGALLGGLIFEGLNQILNNRGAFLRKKSLLHKHVEKKKRTEAKRLLKSLSKTKLLASLPAEQVISLIPRVERRKMKAGECVFEEDAPGEQLYFIVSGKVSIARSNGDDGDSKVIATLGPGEVFGEIALVSDRPRTATARAVSNVNLLEIHKHDFDEVLRDSAGLQEAIQNTIQSRIKDLTDKEMVEPHHAQEWETRALTTLERISLELRESDIEDEVEAHGGGGQAATAIWMGIALDGIPESLVIGMLVVAAAAHNTTISLAFIVGVFLANLPEAMSSSVTMRESGLKVNKIFWMWMSLCIMTGLGGFLGTIIFPPNPEGWIQYFLFGIEGLAAGAMLTMIAETMLPEAFEQGGGTIVGLSTLVGFLAALSVKLIH